MDTASLIFAMFVALAAATLVGEFLASRKFPLPDRGRIGQIDGLRGYLALAVMCHHFVIWSGVNAGRPWSEPKLAFFNQLGKGGVGLFFMTTGIVFYPRILRGLRENNWVSIYISRVFRIVPLLLASVLAITGIIMVRFGLRPDEHYPLQVLTWLMGVPQSLMGFAGSTRINAGVLWSIFFEWQFYFLVLPLCALLRMLVGGRTWIVPAALLVLSLAARPIGGGLAGFAPLFAMGMLGYEAGMRPGLAAALRSRVASVAALASLGVGMTMFRTPFDIAALPLFGFFFACVACGNDLFGILRTRGARVLGEISYGIYLIHGTVLYLTFTLVMTGPAHIVALPLLAVLVTLICAGTFLAIENPFIHLGRKLSKRLTGKRPAAAKQAVAPS